MPSGKQIRAARALADWSGDELARRVGLTRKSIQGIESDGIRPRASTAEKIVQVFTDIGIEFIGEAGVIQKDDLTRITGENVYVRLLDDVIASCRNRPDQEALFTCVVDSVSPPLVIENYRRLRREGVRMRSLVQEGDTYLMGQLNEYRYVKREHFHNNATIIYGNKFATMILDEKTGADSAAVIINNASVAAAQRNLFELIWNVSPPPTFSTAKERYE